MNTMYRKRINYGNRYFKEFCCYFLDRNIEIELTPDYDLCAADKVFEFLTSLNWMSDGKNVTSLANLENFIERNMPELFNQFSTRNLFLILPSRIGKFTGFIEVRTENAAESIADLCLSDKDGIIIVSEKKEVIAIFSFEIDTQTVSVYCEDGVNS